MYTSCFLASVLLTYFLPDSSEADSSDEKQDRSGKDTGCKWLKKWITASSQILWWEIAMSIVFDAYFLATSETRRSLSLPSYFMICSAAEQ